MHPGKQVLGRGQGQSQRGGVLQVERGEVPGIDPGERCGLGPLAPHLPDGESCLEAVLESCLGETNILREVNLAVCQPPGGARSPRGPARGHH